MSVSGHNPSDDIEDLRDYDIFDPDSKIYDDIYVALTFSIVSENFYDQDYFENYDYIIGDWSYGKLRLKGFCNKINKICNKINDIKFKDDYIKNLCSYECKYFVLEKVK